MQIEADIVVKIEDGEVTFEEPSLKDWAVMLAMDGKPMEEQAEILLAKVKAVKGFTDRSGAEVTLEDFRAKKFPARFFLTLMNGWMQAVIAGIKGEAEAKNAETLN